MRNSASTTSSPKAPARGWNVIRVPKVLGRWSHTKHAVVLDLTGVFMLDTVCRNLANQRDACGRVRTFLVGYTETPTHWHVHYAVNRTANLLRALPPGRGD